MSSSNGGRNLVQLLSALPRQLSDLFKAELAQLKADLLHKVKLFGIGAGMFATAALVAVFFLGTLVAAGVLLFALVLPAWAAALIVAGILLVIIAVLVVLGIVSMKLGAEPLESIASIRRDTDAIKGVGEYDRRD